MELRHLRYFLAVAEESTFTAAATRLHLAQPALTRQIHDLERELGVELFDRGPRGASLTPAGEVCLSSARHILKQVERAIERARGSSHGAAGRCVICSGARALVSGLIPRIVARVHAEYPQIELLVVEGIGPKQWKMLQLSEADIGLGVLPTSYPGLVSETFDHDVFDSIIVARDHPLAARTNLRLEDLSAETMLIWKSTFAGEFDRMLRAEMKRLDVKLKHRRDFDEFMGLASAVSAGLGFALISSRMAAFATADTVIVPVKGLRIPMVHSVIYKPAGMRPVVRTVIEMIRRVAADDRANSGKAPLESAEGHAPSAPTRVAEEMPAAALSIELRHLRYYSAVVETRSFGRAAERLELTQPALSRQIRDLERAVGLQLLDRSARGATTTPAGESFYRSARHILDEAASLPAEAHRAERGMRATCLVGTVPTPDARALATELLRRCATDISDMDLRFEELSTTKQPEALRAARIDVGLCHSSPLSPVEERGIRRERLVEDSMNCALLSAEHPLAKRESIDLHELADLPFLFMTRSFQPRLYDQVFGVFSERGFEPRVEATYEGLKTVWALVAEGRGWGVAFQSQCADPPHGTVSVRVNDFALPQGLDLLVRDTEARSSILRVLDILQDITQSRRSATGPAQGV